MFSPFYVYLITIIKLNQMSALDSHLMTSDKSSQIRSPKNLNHAASRAYASQKSLSPKASSLHQTIVSFEEGKFLITLDTTLGIEYRKIEHK